VKLSFKFFTVKCSQTFPHSNHIHL